MYICVVSERWWRYCLFILGIVTIPDGIRFTLDSGASPQFTLTCISTGGPATTVTWTRDSVTVTEGTETVLDNRVTSQYTHTLTVTGRLGGLYTCTVANNRPSNNVTSAQLTVQGTCSYLVMAMALLTICLSSIWILLLMGCNWDCHSHKHVAMMDGSETHVTSLGWARLGLG